MSLGELERGSRGRPLTRRITRVLLLWAASLPLLVPAFLGLPTPAQGQLSLAITMRDLFFEPAMIFADPGDNITLRLVNAGRIDHTFTLFAEVNASVPVDDDEALKEFHSRSATLVDVPLGGGGQEITVNFIVPSEIGVYIFVCMVTNHAAGSDMHGAMFVGASPEGGDPFGGIGIVQGIFLIALVGVLVFAVVYHVRSTRT